LPFQAVSFGRDAVKKAQVAKSGNSSKFFGKLRFERRFPVKILCAHLPYFNARHFAAQP